jgi:hypothetical protein
VGLWEQRARLGVMLAACKVWCLQDAMLARCDAEKLVCIAMNNTCAVAEGGDSVELNIT